MTEAIWGPWVYDRLPTVGDYVQTECTCGARAEGFVTGFTPRNVVVLDHAFSDFVHITARWRLGKLPGTPLSTLRKEDVPVPTKQKVTADG